MDSPTRGKSEDGPTREEFAEQIVQLTYLVQEMKDGFVSAMQELSVIQSEDIALHDQVKEHKEDVNSQLAELTSAIKEIKSEMKKAISKVQENSATTQQLCEQVEHLQYERTVLIEELTQDGCISDVLRKKKLKKNYEADDRKEKVCDLDLDIPEDKLDISTLSILDYDSDDSDDGLDLENDEKDYYKDLEKESVTTDLEANLTEEESVKSSFKRTVQLRRGNEVNCQESSGSCNSSFGPMDFPPKQTEFISSEEALRQTLARQFLESERRYVNQLQTTQQHFNNPLLGEGFIPQPDISVMFPTELASLLQKHKSLLMSLQSRLNTWKWQGMMGDILARITDTYNADTLDVYTSYIANFPRSLSKMSYYCQKSHTFRKFLRKQLSSLGFIESDLVGSLLSPVQRIPQYVIFLKQLSRCTSVDHPDYIYVQSSTQRLTDFVTEQKPAIESAIQTTKQFPVILYKRKENKLPTYYDSTSMNAKTPSQGSSTKDSGIHSNDEQIPENRTSRLIQELNHTHQLLSELAASPVFQLKSTEAIQHSHFSDFKSKAINKYRPKSRNKARMRHKMLQFRSAPSLSSMNASHIEDMKKSESMWMKTSKTDVTYPEQSLAKSQPALARYGLVQSNHSTFGQLSTGLINGNHSIGQLSSGYSLRSDVVIPHAEISDMRNSPYINDKFDFSTNSRILRGRQQHRTLPTSSNYGIYGADDTDLDSVCYVPSTLTNAPSRTMQLKTMITTKVEEANRKTGCDNENSFPILRESPIRDADDMMYKSLPIIAPCDSPICQKSSDTYGTPTYDSASIEGGSITENSKHYSQPDLRKISKAKNRKKKNAADADMPTPLTVWNDAGDEHYVTGKTRRNKKHVAIDDSKLSSKKSFKHSLKSIFFRKKGQTNKVVHIAEAKGDEPPMKESADEVFSTQAIQPSMLGSTYQDENGDPCSTV
ncbi:uncharacterized protein [Antedon mediterranea]|uniref:uncharacterized protein n=1 Tax=Antedon mediterranea TaxID=105859 RepID=UPI003AF473EE